MKTIQYIDDYHHPYLWHGKTNPQHQGWSQNIWHIRKDDPISVETMVPLIANMIEASVLNAKFDMICAVPSNLAFKNHNGIQLIARKLSHRFNCIDGSTLLVRVIDKPTAQQGGHKIRWHHRTLAIHGGVQIESHRILLLDRLTNSGQTLQVVGQMLLNAGASIIIPMALGKLEGSKSGAIKLQVALPNIERNR